MRRFALLVAFLALAPVIPAAQVAGSATAGTSPIVAESEIGVQFTLQKASNLFTAEYRFAAVPDLIEVGLRLGGLSTSGHATAPTGAIEAKAALMTRDHPAALLPIDIALFTGAGAAFPASRVQMLIFPIGLSAGGVIPFDVGLERPGTLYLFVAPRFEFARHASTHCDSAGVLCQTGWAFRTDIGVSGDLSSTTDWYVVGGFGDSRFTGNGLSFGLRRDW